MTRGKRDSVAARERELSHAGLVGLRWAGLQWNPSNMTMPRIRLWPSDDSVLVFVGLTDGNCDPVAGVDLYITGWLGDRLSDWLWNRECERSERRRAA